MSNARAWWKEAVVYQIYPRSFFDSNADGVGDLPGILQKIDYIKSLGVDAVWLNPIFRSPNDDGGYDISDYYQLQPEFGTMADFDALLTALHSNGLRLIMDIVLNHSSDEHPWFQQARQARGSATRNYYFWRDGSPEAPPNNWPSFFGGSAWQWNEPTRDYYLHLFSKKQPDLNWESDELRHELHAIMKFWLDKGVDGLRLDVISTISKRTDFPPTDTADFNETIRRFYANGPRLREFIRHMRTAVWNNYPGIMTVGEGTGITPENARDYLHESDGLHMIFHFGHMFIDQGPGGRFDPVPWTMQQFKEVFLMWDRAFADGGWGSVFLGNHDFARMVSRWADDGEYRELSAKMLLTLLCAMRGTPFLFQGDELGMTNWRMNSVAESHDIETQNEWREAAKKGMTERDFLQRANYAGRDNARTPFQWSAAPQAGFTTGTPWMPVNQNHTHINQQQQEHDPHSVLAYARRAIAFRKANIALVYGHYQPLAHADEKVFAFTRTQGEEKWLVALNFSSHTSNLPSEARQPRMVYSLGNYPSAGVTLRPWEAAVFRLENG